VNPTVVSIGTLQLSHDNTFKGGVTVSGGTLLLKNRTGSGSGSGDVTVQEDVLDSQGIVAGRTTIGTGSGTGSYSGGDGNDLTLTVVQ